MDARGMALTESLATFCNVLACRTKPRACIIWDLSCFEDGKARRAVDCSAVYGSVIGGAPGICTQQIVIARFMATGLRSKHPL